MSGPLAPHDRRLRRRRYEVTAFGPKDPETTARKVVSGPDRFADLPSAMEHAVTLQGDVVSVMLWAPQSARYPDGPWRSTLIHTFDPVEDGAL